MVKSLQLKLPMPHMYQKSGRQWLPRHVQEMRKSNSGGHAGVQRMSWRRGGGLRQQWKNGRGRCFNELKRLLLFIFWDVKVAFQIMNDWWIWHHLQQRFLLS